MGGDNFQKSDFNKAAKPFCGNCGMLCAEVAPSDAKIIVLVETSTSYSGNINFKCTNCLHIVDNSGDCIINQYRRCSSCQGRPKCNICKKISTTQIDEIAQTLFYCEQCEHPLGDDGNCKKNEYCVACNPHTCNTCDRNLEGELDSDDEIYCDDCEHTVDSDGDCVDTNTGHCYTCDGNYPTCPGCGGETSEDGYYDEDDEDEDGEYTHRYSCDGDCEHDIDTDGDCSNDPCTDCGKRCSYCDNLECHNGYDCEFRQRGECTFCHCNHDEYSSETPDCPECNDSNDVEGPDSDGDYRCTYSDCSGDYFR